MKAMIFFHLFGAVMCLTLLNSCETTGDPSTGGIFWSEAKAQQRLADRQNHLDQLDSQTGKTNRSSAYKEQQIKSMQR